MRTVYASKGGSRYHASRECRAFKIGQWLHDWDVPEDAYLSRWAFPAMHALRETTVPAAMGDGKEPCAVCLPGSRAAYYRTNAEDDYGHEPVWIDYDHFCARCRSRVEDESGDLWTLPTVWPCASAVVLGLVPEGGVAS